MHLPRRIAYRVGLGAAVSVLLIATVGMLAVVTYLNTRAAVIELTHERIDDLLHGLSGRVESHMLSAVPAVLAYRRRERMAARPA